MGEFIWGILCYYVFMLNLIGIKQAIITTNASVFPNTDAGFLFASRKKVLLKQNPGFIKIWYEGIYKDWLYKIIEDDPNLVSERARIIAQAHKTNDNKTRDRNDIYNQLTKLSKRVKKSEPDTTINYPQLESLIVSFSQNIKNIIFSHCIKLLKEDPSQSFCESFAQKIINNIIEHINDLDEYALTQGDKRTPLFNSVIYSDEIDNPYRKLAILSILALIPIDATKTQTKAVYLFSSALNEYCFADNIGADNSVFQEEITTINSHPASKLCKDDIWKSGKQWYDESRETGRFTSLKPDQYIIPEIKRINAPVHSDDNKDLPLMSAIRNAHSHIYLIGEGGIGKTTSLYSIMEDEYKDKTQPSGRPIPLFIELSKAYNTKDFDLNNAESFYIRNSLLRLISNNDKTQTKLDPKKLSIFIQKNANIPEFDLLLDGLNEVSREELSLTRGNNCKRVAILTMVIKEIQTIMHDFSNTRVILTSRSNDSTIEKEVKPLYLSGINRDTVLDYLKDKIPSDKLEKTKKNEQLMGILRIPLFLIMYAKLKENDQEELLSRGEILHTYYVKRREAYRKVSSDVCIRPSMLSFIIDFILPEIAWKMAKYNKYQISGSTIESIVEKVLINKTPISCCGPYGKACFSDYITTFENTSIVADSIVASLGGEDNMNLVTKKIITCLSTQLDLLRAKDSDEYVIAHQHLRDYFAALYHIYRIKLAVYLKDKNNALAVDCLSELNASPLPNQVSVFIGEALGETHNVPEYIKETNEWKYVVPDSEKENVDRNLIKRCFDIYRGKPNKPDDFAVWNLFQILKLVRKDLSGGDFSNLDLSYCRANGIKLVNASFAAILSEATVNDEFFMPYGHSLGLTCAQYSSDEKYIITAAEDGKTKIWNATSLEEKESLEANKSIVNSARFGADNLTVLTASNDKTAKIWIWNRKTGKHEIHLSLEGHNGSVLSATYNPKNGNQILTSSSDETARIWTINEESYESEILRDHKGRVSFAQFNPNANRIVTASYDKTAIVWYTDPLFSQWPLEHSSFVNSAQFNHTGKKIVTASADGDVIVWTWNGSKYVGSKPLKHSDTVYSACFNPINDDQIVTASADGTAKVWICDNGSYSVIKSLPASDKAVVSSQFSPQGHFILTASKDAEAVIWDAVTYEKVGILKRTAVSTQNVYEVHYSGQVSSFPSFPGLELWGLDLRYIRNSLSKKNLNTFKTCGAIVDNEIYWQQVSLPKEDGTCIRLQIKLFIETEDTDGDTLEAERILVARYISDSEFSELTEIIQLWLFQSATKYHDLDNLNLGDSKVQIELTNDLNHLLKKLSAHALLTSPGDEDYSFKKLNTEQNKTQRRKFFY